MSEEEGMEIDKLITLSFAMYSNKGAYALFLGAGISRAAHIMAGWEIEEEMISRLGALKGATIDEGDWHDWYKQEYGEKANYSDLLNSLTTSPTERVQLMNVFFEPNNEELELGWKKPTKAHKAIARLVKAGYIKVIITTNFDRLVELALQEEGLTPQVVYSESDFDHITPLVHAAIPTVIKVNGDYIDCKFRNTTEELDDYPPLMKEQLKWIFANYGIITIGWSANWDNGLRAIMKESAPSRYGSFFTYMVEPSENLKEIASLRGGETIDLKNADHFLSELSERVLALEKLKLSKTISEDIVIARVKKYLTNSQYDIDYNDLVESLIDEAYEKIMAHANYNFQLSAEALSRYDELHYNAVKPLMIVAIIVANYGKPKHFKVLEKALVKLCTFPTMNFGIRVEKTGWLHIFAPSLLLYALGVACVKNDNFAEIERVFKLQVPKENFFSFNREKLLYLITPNHWDRDVWKALTGSTRYYLPSLYYSERLKPLFQKEFVSESEYNNYFNIWERLMSLLYGYHECGIMGFYIPIGFFVVAAFEYKQRELGNSPYCEFWDGAEKLKEKWPPIAQGMFGGNYKEYEEIEKAAQEYYQNYREY